MNENRTTIPQRSPRALRLAAGLVLLAGAFAAGVALREPAMRWIGGASTSATRPADQHATTKPAAQLWTCSMHPQVIKDGPGTCPICHMTLTPMTAAAHAEHADEAMGPAAGGVVMIEPAMAERMGVRTAAVRSGPLTRVVRAVGSLEEPEGLHRDINLRVSGWVAKLYANTDGMPIDAGQILFDLYSPELTLAAEELIAARKQVTADAATIGMFDATRAKLERMGLERTQIDALAKLDAAPTTIPILSPMSGHLTAKMVNDGSAVKAGELVMRIADRSQMWADLQVYEHDIPFVQLGEPVSLTIASLPGETITGEVSFIHPHLDMMTRSAKVRVVMPNVGHRLREGMYVSAQLQATVAAAALLIPREAIIDTGVRQIAFVTNTAGKFELRTLTVGASDGAGLVQILAGLERGEEVVTSGQFLIDSESRTQEAVDKLLRDREAAR